MYWGLYFNKVTSGAWLKCFPVNFYEHLFNDTENRSFAVFDLFHMSTKKDLYLRWYEHH